MKKVTFNKMLFLSEATAVTRTICINKWLDVMEYLSLMDDVEFEASVSIFAKFRVLVEDTKAHVLCDELN